MVEPLAARVTIAPKRAQNNPSAGPARLPALQLPPTEPIQRAAFDRSVADAQTRRAGVEHRSPESHGYETAQVLTPGGSVGQVANERGADYSRTVANNPQLPNPAVVAPGTVVLTPEKSPVTPETEKLIDKASAYDRSLNAPPEPGEDNTSDGNWKAAQDAIAGELRKTGKGKAKPEIAAGETTDKLNNWAIGSNRLRQASGGALKQVTGEWRKQGVTGDTFGKVESAYGDVKKADAHENDVRNDPTLSTSARKTKLAEAQKDTDKKTGIARDVVARQLEDARKSVPPGSDPKVGFEAMQARARTIASLGPKDGDFQSVIKLGQQKAYVDDPAKRVADAYQHGGAREASRALKNETKGVGEEYAADILGKAQPTVEKIAQDIGKAAPIAQDFSKDDVRKAKDTVFGSYGDLSTAVQQAGRSRNGRSAIDATADKLAKYTPNQVPRGFTVYTDAARDASIRDGSNILTMAFAGALNRKGESGKAALLADHVVQDLREHKGITEKATDNFMKLTGELNQFRADWGGALTKGQLDKATVGYADRHPGFREDVQKKLGALQKSGNNAYNAVFGASFYGDELKGIRTINGKEAVGVLKGARNDLTGDNSKSAFAMQQGGQMNADIASVIDASPGASGQNEGLNPYPTMRTTKVFTKTYLSAAPRTLSPVAGGTLNGVGALLFAHGLGEGHDALSKPFSARTVPDAAMMLQQGMGFTRDASELLATLAPQKLTEKSSLATKGVDFVTKSPAWKVFDVYYKVGFTNAGVLSAGADLLQGDPVAASLSLANAGGWSVLARAAGDKALQSGAKRTLITAIATRLPGVTITGPVGAGIVLATTAGQFIWEGVKGAKEKGETQDRRRDFLVDSGAVRPEIADRLAHGENNDGSLGPLIQELARHQGASSPQMLAYLNRQDPDQVKVFADIAAAVKKNDDGTYAETADNDQNFLYPGVPSYVPQPDGDRLPRSLNGLAVRESAVFGYGDSPRGKTG